MAKKYKRVDKPKTTGRLSFEHMDFIDKNKKSMSVAEIATALNRTQQTIKRYIREKEANELLKSVDDEKLKSMLHQRHYWPELKKQFSRNELIFFENQWVDFYKQFSSDVTPSEESQLQELIRVSILINRIMKNNQEIEEKIEQLQVLVDIEMEKPKKEIDTQLVGDLQQQMAGYSASKGSFLRDYDTLVGRQEKLTKELKADRANRKRKSEDSTSSFSSYVRFLEQENVKNKEGNYMSVLGKAADKSRESLYEYHEYSDGQVDLPILNSESVKED